MSDYLPVVKITKITGVKKAKTRTGKKKINTTKER